MPYRRTSQEAPAVLDPCRLLQPRQANVHRGAHQLAPAHETYEGPARSGHLHRGHPARNLLSLEQRQRGDATLVARSWGDENIRPGDEISCELHSNLCPGSCWLHGPVAVLRHAASPKRRARPRRTQAKLSNANQAW